MTPETRGNKWTRGGRIAVEGGRQLAAFCLVTISACSASLSAAPRPVAGEAQSISYGLRFIQGDDFAIGVPREALVERRVDSLGQTQWTVRAPAQLITATLGTADTTRFTNDIPLYELTVSTRRKPAAQALKAWGDSVVAADEAQADELTRGEAGHMETVAGEPAYLRNPTCGDCGVYIFTFAHGDRLVEVEYSMDTSEPLGVRKHGIYALILSTFRWTAPAGR